MKSRAHSPVVVGSSPTCPTQEYSLRCNGVRGWQFPQIEGKSALLGLHSGTGVARNPSRSTSGMRAMARTWHAYSDQLEFRGALSCTPEPRDPNWPSSHRCQAFPSPLSPLERQWTAPATARDGVKWARDRSRRSGGGAYDSGHLHPSAGHKWLTASRDDGEVDMQCREDERQSSGGLSQSGQTWSADPDRA